MSMLIGRFPGAAGPLATGFVRPSSTMRTRGLAATSAASYEYSFTSLVYVALPLVSHCVRIDAPGPVPHCGSVVPKTGSE